MGKPSASQEVVIATYTTDLTHSGPCQLSFRIGFNPFMAKFPQISSYFRSQLCSQLSVTQTTITQTFFISLAGSSYIVLEVDCILTFGHLTGWERLR